MVTQYIGPEMRTETRAGSFTMKEKKHTRKSRKQRGKWAHVKTPSRNHKTSKNS